MEQMQIWILEVSQKLQQQTAEITYLLEILLYPLFCFVGVLISLSTIKQDRSFLLLYKELYKVQAHLLKHFQVLNKEKQLFEAL